MHINAQALQSSLQQLRRAPHEADVIRVMQRVVTAVDHLFGYSGAGIMFISDSEQLTYVAASDEGGRRLEEAQIASGQGPCYDAYIYARPIASKDLHSDARWPDLAGLLPAEVRAVAGVPITLGGSPVGTLNVYLDRSAEWDDSDLAALGSYADLVEEVLGAALAAEEKGIVVGQLQHALNYRVVIERAIGYLMAAHQLDAISAFDMLRKRARDSRRKVADVAAEVLGDTQPPPSPRDTVSQ